MTLYSDQLGFGDLLAEADETNAAKAFDKQTAHLPDTMTEAMGFHRQQIEAHHVAMLRCDFETVITIREEAHLLAKKLNGGAPGILADETAPGCVLAKACAAQEGDVPLWGQEGRFRLEVSGVASDIAFNGMFGLGGCYMPFTGFDARAADPTKPFISQTGYRSFLGCSVAPEEGMTPDVFAARVIQAHIAHGLGGILVSISH